MRFCLFYVAWMAVRRPAIGGTAPVDHYLGYTIRDIQSRTTARFGRRPSVATVLQWVREFGKYAAIKNLRPRLKAFDRPGRMIAGGRFRLPRPFLFLVHRYKLDNMAPAHPALHQYLNRLLTGDLKIDPRTFDPAFTLDLELPAPKAHKSYACAMAALAGKAAASDARRRAALQKFLLATDKATVATGVPVFLSSGETRTVLRRMGGWLGRIGFLQVWGDYVTILDYQPEAGESALPGQLLLRALALSQRTGIHLKRISCAWFNEKKYHSFPAMEGYGKIFPNYRIKSR
jgi:hypothetical protein